MKAGMLLCINSEALFWCGIILMGIAVFGGIVCGITLFFKGKMIKKELESDYGEIGK